MSDPGARDRCGGRPAVSARRKLTRRKFFLSTLAAVNLSSWGVRPQTSFNPQLDLTPNIGGAGGQPPAVRVLPAPPPG